MRLAWLALIVIRAACPQAGPDGARDGIEWSVALRGRIREMRNPVVVAYGTARLGAMICAKDAREGSPLFRDALAFADSLKSDAFDMSSLLQHTGQIEWARVAAILAGLLDENTGMNSLIDLAAVRLANH